MDPLSSFSTDLKDLDIILLEESDIFLGYLFGGIITLIDEAENVFVIISILFGLLDPKLFQILE